MRVITTANEKGLADYGHRWLESRKNWPEGTEFHWFTEGYYLPAGFEDIQTKDFDDMRQFKEWKARHVFYLPPSWRFDVVRFAHKVFAACNALENYKGVGVWLDADCVTFEKIPEGLVEAQVKDAYIAQYGRTGHYSETGFWVMNCAHPDHKAFLDSWRNIYLSGKFRQLHEWVDCTTLDETIRRFRRDGKITTKNLSGDYADQMHPQALSEFGKYFDHCKGPRKAKGYSAENAAHVAIKTGSTAPA